MFEIFMRNKVITFSFQVINNGRLENILFKKKK